MALNARTFALRNTDPIEHYSIIIINLILWENIFVCRGMPRGKVGNGVSIGT